MEVTVVDDLRNLSLEKLVEGLGAKQGRFLKNISTGMDDTEVQPSEKTLKSFSEEDSFRKLTDFNEVKRQMELLTRKVLVRLDKEKQLPKTIKLTLRKHFMADNYSRVSRQAPFDARILSIKDDQEKIKKITNTLVQLFDKMIDRSVGFDLAVINVGFTNSQQRASSSTLISNFFKNSNETVSAQKNGFAGSKKPDYIIDKRVDTGNNSGIPFVSSKRIVDTSASYSKFRSNNTVPAKEVAEGASEIAESASEIAESASEITEGASEITEGASGTTEGASEIAEGASEITEGALEKVLPEHTITGHGAASCSKIDASANSASKDSQKEQREVFYPANIDPEVFSQLPSEIQNELLTNWRARCKTKDTRNTRSSPPKKKQKQSKDVKTKSILNYFSK